MLVPSLLIAFACTSTLRIELTNGQMVDPFLDRSRISVVIFVTDSCPISRKYSPYVAKLAARYPASKVRFLAIHADPDTDFRSALRFQREFRLPFPAGVDPFHNAANFAGIKTVPTAVVYDAKGDLRYQGRIDDRFPRLGVLRPAAQREDLRIALDELLRGRKVTVPRTTAIGCLLPAPRS